MNRMKGRIVPQSRDEVINAFPESAEKLHELDDHSIYTLGFLLDHHHADDLTDAIKEKLCGAELENSDALEVAAAIESVAEQINGSGLPTESVPSEQEIWGELWEALSEDVREACGRQVIDDLIAEIVQVVWGEIKGRMSEEVAAHPGAWNSDELREASYDALNQALDGFLDDAEKHGGITLLDCETR
ncbi:hypothetical protein [Streptomyces wuyuanensis]|uniref:hypothetical protein n=1 Tax=Streptomyces wuyuanensis TaxID=1196353 RepID=UPI0034235E1C